MNTTMQSGPSPAGGVPAVSLAPAHLDVLRLAAYGYTDQRIADHMGLSIHTVRDYWRIIKDRLHAEDRCHAVALAVASGAVTMGSTPGIVQAKPSSHRLLDLVTAAGRGGLTGDEEAELRSGVERLYRARRSGRDEHAALQRAQQVNDTAVRRLSDLCVQMPVSMAPWRRAIGAVVQQMQAARSRSDAA